MYAFSLVLLIFYVATSSAKESPVDDVSKVPVEPTGPFPICAVRCASVGPPVCAIRHGVKSLFLNSCAKSGHYCNTGEIWNEVPLSYCTTSICPISCCSDSDSYPVCATNSSGGTMTFAGRCAFMNYACLHPTEGWSQQHCP